MNVKSSQKWKFIHWALLKHVKNLCFKISTSVIHYALLFIILKICFSHYQNELLFPFYTSYIWNYKQKIYWYQNGQVGNCNCFHQIDLGSAPNFTSALLVIYILPKTREYIENIHVVNLILYSQFKKLIFFLQNFSPKTPFMKTIINIKNILTLVIFSDFL